MPPVRILHLIDAGPGAREGPGAVAEAPVTACAAVVRAVAGAEHQVCLIGPGELERVAASAGLATTDRIVAPLGRPWLAWRGLRALVRDRGRPRIVHAWSPGVRRLARLSLGTSAPCVRLPLSPAPVWPRRIDTCRRAEARVSLGLDDADCVVLLAGDRAETDALRFVFLLSLLARAGVRATGIVPDAAARLPRALRLHRRMGARSRLLVTRASAAERADVGDVAVWVGPADGGIANDADAADIAVMHASGVPVVAPIGLMMPATAAAIAARCAAHNVTPPELARVLLPLASDPSLREAAGRYGKACIERMRPGEAFVAAAEEAYRRAVGSFGEDGRGVRTPEPEGATA